MTYKLINTDKLKEELYYSIRCGTCTNHMRSDGGCDGGCQFDAELLDKVNDIIGVYVDNLPARPKGEWIENAPEWQNIDPPYICSECGYAVATKMPFCEMCGASMGGNQDE